jgi:outer membrane protein
VASFNVKELEGGYLPNVSVQGTAGSTFNAGNGIDRQDSAAISLNVTVPIYQGGRVSAQVRQAKEQLGSSRIQVDVIRDQVRQNTIARWAAYKASLRSIQSARTGVFAAQLALQGVVEERRVGQRTTLDVLNAQRDLIEAQVTLVRAERDAKVDAFALLSAIGRLSVSRLGLQVAMYDPVEHADAVRDKWYGYRTPDGR